MRGTEKGRTLVLSALICTIIFAILGIQDAKSINAETPEETANKQVTEIVTVTVTPKKEATTEYINFDLRHLSIVRQEGEEDGVINSGTHGDGEPATVTEDSGRDESDTQGYSDDNSGDEYSVGETDGSEMAESGQEQWSESEDIVSEDRDGESMPELVESELSAEESYDAEYENGDNGQYESEVDSGLNNGEGWVYYANCRITHYCPCAACCGEWATGYTANGSLATEGRTVATGADIPFGTEVMIGDQVYIAEDRGVGYGEIDVFVNDHQTALNMGMYYTDVYIRSAD